MKEEFLHYVWKYKLFVLKKLQTSSKENITIVKSGIHNFNEGPDFLNAQLKINNQIWVGNVEIHLKSSDWYVHQHEVDENYDAVILHVVWEHDTEVYMKNNVPIPTLVLKDLVNINVLKNYQNLSSNTYSWIPCQSEIHSIGSFIKDNWLERLYIERLEIKSILIKSLLEKTNNDYETVLFQLLAKNFGLKLNGDAFLQMAKSLDFTIVKKERVDEHKLLALLFGQAGFLEGDIEDVYYLELKNEYQYLKHKYRLQPMSKNQFQFFRMRPTNFPTIRIAQFTRLIFKHQNLFSKLIKIEKLDDFYKLLSVEVSSFWKTHYTFQTTSKKRAKKLTKSFIDLLLINTIVPLKFQYLKSRGEVNENDFLKLIKQIKPEKNSIVSKFSDLKITAKNAFETQALLELKNNYCASKRCLECAIGNQLLKR
jgi:hypothetical protein